MVEVKVAPGRYLVSVGGYDKVNNDPSGVFKHLEGVMEKNHHLLGEFLRFSDVQLKENSNMRHLEPYVTAYAELLFLQGKTDLARVLMRLYGA
ncbi:MAG: hypothetical protein HYW45_01585 [Candidatus Daviesbacteria bacterium]|nr:MAG: hypothetical protein HYW45_01585 [Candidatus Daviesbacteria bacterium]